MRMIAVVPLQWTGRQAACLTENEHQVRPPLGNSAGSPDGSGADTAAEHKRPGAVPARSRPIRCRAPRRSAPRDGSADGGIHPAHPNPTSARAVTPSPSSAASWPSQAQRSGNSRRRSSTADPATPIATTRL